jgi:hypothetical protein
MPLGAARFGLSGGAKPDLVIDYLVVAGGASGGSRIGGGGGAGGLRCTVDDTGGGGSLESALTLTPSTNYTVTIGAGGAAVVSTDGTGAAGKIGNNGANSVFATITSTGGGGGGAYYNTGVGYPNSGGSGGGASYETFGTPMSGASGTTNQGFAGGDRLANDIAGAGGGGAGETGYDSTPTRNGGDGVQTSISGSATYYAGGGGGSPSNDSTTGLGGLGGGGKASIVSNGNATNGTANLGAGGGGARNESDTTNVYSGAGGSGVVILRYPKQYSITVGGSLTSSTITSGIYKITTFTAGSDNVSWS